MLVAFDLGKPTKKNWIFYDNKLISIATYPPYLIMTSIYDKAVII